MCDSSYWSNIFYVNHRRLVKWEWFLPKRKLKKGNTAVAQSTVTNLTDLCELLVASSRKDLGHAKLLVCVDRELIMETESVEGCFRWFCYGMTSSQNNTLWNHSVCNCSKFQWLCLCVILLCLFGDTERFLPQIIQTKHFPTHISISRFSLYSCLCFHLTSLTLSKISPSCAKQRHCNCRREALVSLVDVTLRLTVAYTKNKSFS